MREPQIIGNKKSYYIEKDYIDIWRYEEDFQITDKDLPFLKKAIRLLEKRIKDAKCTTNEKEAKP